MKERADEYITAWQQKLTEVQNESLREASLERRETVRKQYQQVTDTSEQVHKKVAPYLTELKEIRKVLNLDPTPQGVQAASEAIEQSIDQAEPVRAEIDKLRDALYTLRDDLSPPRVP
jgi:chromosome segregation ATPase